MMRKAFLLVRKDCSLEEKTLAHFISDDFSKNVVDNYNICFLRHLISESKTSYGCLYEQIFVTFARKDNSLRINRLFGLLKNWVTR